MKYPQRTIRAGEGDQALVVAIQQMLVSRGCGPLGADGFFGPETESALRLFQTRNNILTDGIVGSVTWAHLFSGSLPKLGKAGELGSEFLRVAKVEEAALVREVGGPNRGPRVEEYLKAVGLSAGEPWCAAFVYWCAALASVNKGTKNRLVKTGSCAVMWAKSPKVDRIPFREAIDNPSILVPGSIFVIDHGHGRGHVGFVEGLKDGKLNTVEGNTNSGGARDGDGVFRRRRNLSEINTGFILPAFRDGE